MEATEKRPARGKAGGSVKLLYEFQRSQPKVFCVGLNKTGTTAFADALKLLGYKRAGWKPKLSPTLLLRWYENKYAPLFRAAYDFDVMADLPWPLAYEQLDAHFPNAKFVLTVRRSDEVWLQSIIRHTRKKGAYVGHRLLYGSLYADEDPEGYRRTYIRHNDAVRAYFKNRPGKLLEMCLEDGDGWRELCRFLGIDEIPEVPFPHPNPSDPSKVARDDDDDETEDSGAKPTPAAVRLVKA